MSILKSLGYITVAASDIDRWRQFAFGVLGFAEGSGPDPSALYLRMDERAARIIVVSGEVGHGPVVTPFGARFVTGDQGLGHVVVPAMDANGLFDFYTGVLGFRSRGAFRVPAPPEFGPIRVRFLGINERHHSLAICPAMNQDKPGVVH